MHGHKAPERLMSLYSPQRYMCFECTFKPGKLNIDVDKAVAVVHKRRTMDGDGCIVGDD